MTDKISHLKPRTFEDAFFYPEREQNIAAYLLPSEV